MNLDHEMHEQAIAKATLFSQPFTLVYKSWPKSGYPYRRMPVTYFSARLPKRVVV
jgi:hypothetical protein